MILQRVALTPDTIEYITMVQCTAVGDVATTFSETVATWGSVV